MDELLIAAKNVSLQLLPVLGVIALIYLCILLNKLSRLVEKATDTVSSLDETVSLVDKSLTKVQYPLDSAVKLSKTVDEVHEKSIEAIQNASEYVVENVSVLKDFVKEKIDSTKSR